MIKQPHFAATPDSSCPAGGGSLGIGLGWFDVMAAAAGLLALSPLLAAIAVAIKLSDGGPVFYRQRRIGQDFRPFALFKFRTMVEGADRQGPSITQRQDPRVTRLGTFLRRYKLDELPQLLNVLQGEMRLVGPRPEVNEYVARFREEYSRLLRFPPGVTDPASLAFHNEEEMLYVRNFEEKYLAEVLPKKLQLSLHYLEQRTWKSDVRILLATLRTFFPAGRGDAAPFLASRASNERPGEDAPVSLHQASRPMSGSKP